MSAELDALDRGLVEVGVTAAEALARVEAVEARVTAIFAAMRAVNEHAGLGAPREARPARHLRLVR